MNVDNILKTSILSLYESLNFALMRASRLAIYQPREFLSVRANYGQWILLAVKFAIIFIT